ncbi:MAG: hypothetical protein QOG60_684 [Frankiaceae bacterium]|nr:hypothetical protein [Frankiaceae bacterium]
MTERQVGSTDRRSAAPRLPGRRPGRPLLETWPAVEQAFRAAYLSRCSGLRGRPGCRRDRVVRWWFKVRDRCRQEQVQTRGPLTPRTASLLSAGASCPRPLVVNAPAA